MKLSRKIPLVVGGALLACAAVALVGFQQLGSAMSAYANVVEVDVAHERQAAVLLADFKTQVQEWKNTLLRGKDPKQLDKYWAAFHKHEADVQVSAKRLSAALPAGPARELTEKFSSAHGVMSQGYAKGFEAFKTASFDSTAGDAAVKGMDREPAELLKAIGERIEADSAAQLQAASAQRNRAVALSLALMLVVTLAGFAGAVLLARQVKRSLGGEPEEVLAAAEAVSAGDLASPLEVPRGAEASVMAGMARMQQSLAHIVGQVRQSSDSIATGSAQIATGNADLSQRTEEQASNLQQTAASMEELTSTVKQNSDTARQANQLASSASQAATQGGVVVSQVVGTMEEITASSRKIADIISVIDGIAFQTNILALNAAVEAARAGEQGRGFAVVAGEVRNLAQRSAEAAKEIKGLIGQSVSKVEAGSKLVDDAGKSMADIVVQVKRVNDLIAEISSASIEQSSGISQVGDAVAQLDQVTQQNAALVEQSAAAADSLKQQAANLAEVVSVFKLGNEGSHLSAGYAAASNQHAAPERRGPNRATNVTRPKFGPAKTTAKATTAPVPAKTGTDDWEAF